MLHISRARLKPRFFNTLGYSTSGAKYAGVPTIDFRKDFFPIILAYPKSHSFTLSFYFWDFFLFCSDVGSRIFGERTQLVREREKKKIRKIGYYLVTDWDFFSFPDTAPDIIIFRILYMFNFRYNYPDIINFIEIIRIIITFSIRINCYYSRFYPDKIT